MESLEINKLRKTNCPDCGGPRYDYIKHQCKKKQCTAITLKGERCRLIAALNGLCVQHFSETKKTKKRAIINNFY